MKKASSTLDVIKKAAQQKGEELTQAAKTASDTVTNAATAVDKSVHKTPWYYLGGVAVVSFLAGIFARPKRKSK